MALTNTMAMAECLGLEFRFVWPANADETADTKEIFSTDFLAGHEIAESALEGRLSFPEPELVVLARHQVRGELDRFDPTPHVEIDNPFGITRLADEDPEVAQARFITCFRAIDWSDGARTLLDAAAAWGTAHDVAAIHVRGGDVVSGPWRHVMYYGKYMPTPYVEYAVAEWSGGDTRPVLVMSDKAELLAWLRRRHRSVVTVADIIPGYAELPEHLQALADVFVMSHCTSVAGPSASAFSSFACSVGGHERVSVEHLIPPAERAGVLRAGIAEIRSEVGTHPFLAPFVARDLLWYLDVFGDRLPLKEQLGLARQAVELEPEFVSAQAHLALVASLLGRWEEAKAAAVDAERVAQGVDRHQDPLFEALAVGVAVGCLALALEYQRPGFLRRRVMSEIRRAMVTTLAELNGTVATMRDTVVFEFDRDEVLGSLDQMLAMVGWLAEAHDDAAQPMVRGLRHWKAEEVDISLFRQPAAGAHQSVAIFEANVRNIERSLLYLSQAMGAAVRGSSFPESDDMRGHIDQVTTSRNGLQWAEGWVIEPAPGGATFRPGLAVGSQSGGGAAVATANRPDLDSIYNNPEGRPSAFKLPVPLDSGNADDTAAHIDGLSTMGLRTPLGRMEPPRGVSG